MNNCTAPLTLLKSLPSLFSLVCLTILCFSQNSFAQQTLSIVTDDGPPHMIQSMDSGIDVDIARGILHQLQYDTQMHYAPLHRSRQLVINGVYDVFLPTFKQQDTEQLYFSKPFIQYRPTVFSLSKNQLDIESIDDLKHYNVVSFQGATGYFGKQFQQAVKLGKYRELHDMSAFPELLLKGRTQVVVLDYYIFFYYLQKYIGFQQEHNIKVHSIIPPVNAHVGFNDKALRDKFNQQLELYNAQGHVERIISQYIGENHSN